MFVPEGPVDNTSALVQVIFWHQTDDESLISWTKYDSVDWLFLDPWSSTNSYYVSRWRQDKVPICQTRFSIWFSVMKTPVIWFKYQRNFIPEVLWKINQYWFRKSFETMVLVYYIFITRPRWFNVYIDLKYISATWWRICVNWQYTWLILVRVSNGWSFARHQTITFANDDFYQLDA